MPDLADLLNPTDLQKFASSDQSWWLTAAGRSIRSFCGWHIFPSVTVTGAKVRIGERGLIGLPSMYVTAVSNLVIDAVPQVIVTGDGNDSFAVTTGSYYWVPPDPANRGSTGAFIQRRLMNAARNPFATVDFVHGYNALPEDVAAVGYELVQQGRSRPGANAKELGAGPYRASLLKTGLSLDDGMKARLWEAGVVRPGIA